MPPTQSRNNGSGLSCYKSRLLIQASIATYVDHYIASYAIPPYMKDGPFNYLTNNTRNIPSLSGPGLILKVLPLFSDTLYSVIMRGSRNFRQGGGGPGQSDKKALTTFFFFFLVLSLFYRINRQKRVILRYNSLQNSSSLFS